MSKLGGVAGVGDVGGIDMTMGGSNGEREDKIEASFALLLVLVLVSVILSLLLVNFGVK